MRNANAASKRNREGCALFWYDLLSLSLRNFSNEKQLLQQQQQKNILHHSNNLRINQNNSKIPSEIHYRWWSPSTCSNWKQQAEAITVARIAVTSMYPSQVEESCGVILKSSGFRFFQQQQQQKQQKMEENVKSNSNNNNFLFCTVPASHLVTVLELFCRRFTCSSTTQQNQQQQIGEKKLIKNSFWKIAAFLSYRVIELDPPEVARALSVISEMSLNSDIGWDTPIFSSSSSSETSDNSNNNNDSNDKNSSNVSSSTPLLTPRGICSYLSCHARLRARRYNAMFSLKALNCLGASAIGENGKEDVEVLRKRMIHDLDWRPAVAAVLEESAAVCPTGDFRSALEFAQNNNFQQQNNNNKKNSAVSESYYQPQSHHNTRYSSVPWSLLPNKSLFPSSDNNNSSGIIDNSEKTEEEKTKISSSPISKFRDKRKETAISGAATKKSDDVVGRCMLQQLLQRSPLNPPRKDFKYFEQDQANSDGSLNFRSINNINNKSNNNNSNNKTFATTFQGNKNGTLQRTGPPSPNQNNSNLLQKSFRNNNQNKNKVWGHKERRRALIARAEELLMFQNVSSSSSSLSKKPLLIWTTISVWSDLFQQLSPQAQAAMKSAAMSTLSGGISSLSKNSSSSSISSSVSAGVVDPYTTRMLAKSNCTYYIPEFRAVIARTALQQLVGYQKTAGQLLHSSHALSKTINGLHSTDIVPKLSLTSSIPPQVLALCTSRVIGSTSCEDLIPSLELHTRSVISPSKTLISMLKLFSEFHFNDKSFQNLVKPLLLSSNSNSEESSASTTSSSILFKKQVLNASCAMLLDATNEFVNTVSVERKQFEANNNNNNNSNSSGNDEVLKSQQQQQKDETELAAKQLFSRVAAIPILVTTAFGKNNTISTAHNALSSIKDPRQQFEVSLRCLKLAFFQSTLLMPNFDFLFVSNRLNNNNDSNVNDSDKNKKHSEKLKTLLEAEGTTELQHFFDESTLGIFDSNNNNNKESSKNMKTFSSNSTTTVVEKMLERVNNNVHNLNINNNNNNENKEISEDLRQAHQDFVTAVFFSLMEENYNNRNVNSKVAALETVAALALKLNVPLPDVISEEIDVEEEEEEESGEQQKENLKLVVVENKKKKQKNIVKKKNVSFKRKRDLAALGF